MMVLLRSIAAAFSFLTRLPVPARAIGEGEVAARAIGQSVIWFPLAGALIGGAQVGVAWLLGGHLPPGLIAVALVALSAALTGGLHLDGLADTFDGWAGGRGDRARTLAIMRDSRIGAHGAVALILSLAGKILAVFYLLPHADLLPRSELLPRFDRFVQGQAFQHGALWPLLAAPVLARWAVVPLIVFFRYARAEGLGSPFQAHTRPAHLAGTTLLVLGAAIGISAGTPSFGDTATAIGIAAASALGVALALAGLLDRRLGGLTGDVYGAAIELTELAVLISATVTLR
jgi:adenosylcobinamide-GDP ribazoletransferase